MQQGIAAPWLVASEGASSQGDSGRAERWLLGIFWVAPTLSHSQDILGAFIEAGGWCLAQVFGGPSRGALHYLLSSFGHVCVPLLLLTPSL